MPKGEKFDALDADIILRALGPPKRDFRVHKLILSLASPVFKGMFSLPQPALDGSRESTVAGIEIVEVTDPAGALDIILRMIYPSFTPPSPPSLRYRRSIRIRQTYGFHLPPHPLIGSSSRDPRTPRRLRLRLRHCVPQINQTTRDLPRSGGGGHQADTAQVVVL